MTYPGSPFLAPAPCPGPLLQTRPPGRPENLLHTSPILAGENDIHPEPIQGHVQNQGREELKDY